MTPSARLKPSFAPLSRGPGCGSDWSGIAEAGTLGWSFRLCTIAPLDADRPDVEGVTSLQDVPQTFRNAP